jgi:3-hydroxybutyryl-CoA dehydrogenase
MKIIVAAADHQWNELTALRPGVNWLRVDDAAAFNEHKNADAFFWLYEGRPLPGLSGIEKPVLINSVVDTLSDLHVPDHVLRINGWPGFLKRTTWEIAGKLQPHTEAVFQYLSIKINPVKDEPGFIAARIIAMIINEAYFALEEKVSSKADIDIAMKLGTNYPFGPFEWAGLIGTEKIAALLNKLNITDNRYQPSFLLIKETTEKIS